MREGSLDAPVRHPIRWNDPDFYDWEKINDELERVFDICHGCRRCFNLCDSFPLLFDLIDDSPSGELDSVDRSEYKKVVDACTLCDMCFMVSCPYVPPHEFDLDFPHLMLRYRAAERHHGHKLGMEGELTKTDRNGKLAAIAPWLANWASERSNGLTRPLLERVAKVDRQADLPKYHGKPFIKQARNPETVNSAAPAAGRKAVLYATCFVNYNNPDIGVATRRVMAHNGVETEVVYPRCCGMPQFEQGEVEKVAEAAREIAGELIGWIERGYDVVALTPSCALMMKFEWPLLLPEDETIKRVSQATFDVTEYVVDIANKEGLAEGLQPLDGGVALHIACHARAQNMGNKAREMMKLVPEAEIKQLPRCSGHGGSWGVLKGNFETALKVGKPVARDTYKAGHKYVASECPLAGTHILQGLERIDADTAAEDKKPVPNRAHHPIELFARAYGLID
ncbi:heterodisulfide reductase-related iron-sulfur binding cluster [Aquibaculum arenosum]|uniref:Heterodisulfide reductase-related iron-sulfur binding cluster n=1 Tax=Aquibaculum arenosum TaxID=3032591 RepID=A0ABT5YHZ8_9PROT|nr:heterodisulfide reductase-related iron-sulfur binding cluster [Fodinicurvata sp. CAU 1616]MDF2094560.1 heterodisulfide reductase-related iron-sulfur binding cluster [Fodinicurvata sp. CAU 1616]